MGKATQSLISSLGNKYYKSPSLCVFWVVVNRFCSVSIETVAQTMAHAVLGGLKVQVNEV